jgi:hypothetical protein
MIEFAESEKHRADSRTRSLGAFWLLGILAFWLLDSSALAASPFDYYSSLIDTLCRTDYAAAETLAAHVEAEYPGDPAAMLARVGVKAFYAVDVTGGSEDIDVLSMLDSVVQRADAWRERPDADLVSLEFVRATALFARGLILSRQGKVLTGVPLVIKAKNGFGRVIEMEPTFYDAYLGRGAYRFIKFIFLSKIDLFGILGGPEEARRDVDLAIEHGTFSHWMAIDLLAWLAPSWKGYELADSLSAVGLERFPDSRIFYWPLAYSLMDAHGYARAEQVCLALLHQYQKIPADHGFEQLWLYDWLVKCADGQNHPEDAVSYAKAGLGVTYTKFVYEQRKDQLKRLRERVRKNAD